MSLQGICFSVDFFCVHIRAVKVSDRLALRPDRFYPAIRPMTKNSHTESPEVTPPLYCRQNLDGSITIRYTGRVLLMNLLPDGPTGPLALNQLMV